jgi:ribonuclease VapC
MPVPPRRVLAAAALKAQYPIAYADAFAAQLARELSLPLLTSDPEFGPLVAAGLLTAVWLA